MLTIHNAIVWQCRRTADRIEDLRRDGMQEKIMERTGLIPDAYYSGSKLEWILNHVEGVRERAQRGELLFGTVDSWLIWNLTKGAVHVTDYTNASRTMLFDIHKMQWDQDWHSGQLADLEPDKGGCTRHRLHQCLPHDAV